VVSPPRQGRCAAERRARFVSIANLDQMKSMQVNDNTKNSTSQEIQHFVEERLIEVRNLKMQMIQFVSIVNLIQMKLMKVIDNWKNMMLQEP
jgi:hypothetical protein